MPPVVIAGAIAGVGAIGAAAIGSSAQKKAANQASQTAANTAAANNALAREQYAKNEQHLGYWEQQGKPAASILAGLLYPAPATAAPAPAPVTSNNGTTGGGYVGGAPATTPNPSALKLSGFGRLLSPALNKVFASEMGSFDRAAPIATAKYPNEGYSVTPLPQVTGTGSGGGATATVPAPATAQSALSAWDQFRNSTNYQFRYDQGMEALNQGWAARGALGSGAAARAAIEYGQQFASNELGAYMDRLAVQQGLGFSASSALAGVGQNYAGMVMANNNNAASAAANAYLAQGQATANMWGGVANGIGTIAGAVASSYK